MTKGKLPQRQRIDGGQSTGKAEVLKFASATGRQRALSLLALGDVIAAPTDTVYGLMCDYESDEGIARLFTIKGRPQRKPIPILIGEQDQLARLIATSLCDLASDLISRFWPGPLTVILPAAPTLSSILTAGQNTVAVRMPDHDLLRNLMRDGGPLAATSANPSGQPEAQTAAEVFEQLGHQLSLILEDDGNQRSDVRSLPSTIVDLSRQDSPRILRAGPLATQVEEAMRNRC